MNEAPPLPRSPLLMSPDDTALVVVDVQEKLAPLIHGGGRVIWNVGRLIDAAEVFQMPVMITEQYPQGLGKTVGEIARRVASAHEKLSFSCAECAGPLAELSQRGINRLLLAGIETHVCVQQSALDLLSSGFDVYLAVDATGSQCAINAEVAVRRLDSSGVTITTTEAAIFEWCRVASAPQFKQISRIVRETFTPE